MHKVDPSRLDLARQFREKPFGPHGSELQKLLKILRWDPIDDRIIAVQPRRGGPWQLARSTGPKGHPVEIFEGPGYSSAADAQWAIFRRRWERHTGQALRLEGDQPLPAEGRPSGNLSSRSILAYADRFSVEAGGSIAFKVSASGPYRAVIERLRCGDEAGIGLKSTPVETQANGDYPGRSQRVACGSYIEIDRVEAFALQSFTLFAYVWPTTPMLGRRQVLLGGRSYALEVNEHGTLSLRIGEAAVAVGQKLLERHWYLVAASFDAVTGKAWAGQHPLLRYAAPADTTGEASAIVDARPEGAGGFRIAAGFGATGSATAFYNGKIDSPAVAARALSPRECAALLQEGTVPDLGGDVVASWDFSREIPATRIVDGSPRAHHGRTVNLPTRAMKGWNWDGTEYNWAHKPEHYGAIHFHDDDLYDCGWETDFTFEVPRDLASGLYCAHLTCGPVED
jgi:N,N-dimethylformamidase